MAVGCILTLSPDNRVVRRQPIWPWPPRESYPKLTRNGLVQVFRPVPYYNFPLREVLK